MGFPDSSVGKEPTCNVGVPGLIPGSERSAGEGTGYPLQHSWASLEAQLVRNPPAMWETWVDPWVGKITWRRERLPFRYSGLENSMDCILHGVAKSRAQLSDFHLNIVDSDTGFESFQIQIWNLNSQWWKNWDHCYQWLVFSLLYLVGLLESPTPCPNTAHSFSVWNFGLCFICL